ncbi:hypothetical protein ACTQ5F_10935, partial [Jeotgalibaca porci]|uniref:hypothetical protein n=1 Tax=Jeotgalibaca porci TaxID=1868793 RepID=UPI003F925B03
VLCGNLIIGVHGPFLSLKTEKVPVNHFDSPTLFTIEPKFEYKKKSYSNEGATLFPRHGKP